MHLQRFLRLAEDSLATLGDLRGRPSSPSQMDLARRLREELEGLLRAGRTGEGSAFWQTICAELRRLAVEGDPMYFMRWPPIGATMVHGASPVTLRMWRMLRRSPDWHSVWRPALRHPRFGHPPPFVPMLSTNAMAVEHASHLFRYHRAFDAYPHDSSCVVEFGGGFGSMCRLIRAMGFRGQYVIFDLPPVLALQRYYLGLHGITAGYGPEAEVWLCPDLDRITAWLAEGGGKRASLMSTWALSEMPMPLRRRIEALFRMDVARNALLAYQPSFEGVDNIGYFRELMGGSGDRWHWTEAPVDPLDQPARAWDSLYLFGRVG